jgi:acetolactate synthase small subunit
MSHRHTNPDAVRRSAKLLQSFFGVTLSHISRCSETVSKNHFNLSQVSHCHTNPDTVRRSAKTSSIFLRCHTVTQILMQWDGQQKLLQSFLGVTLSHKSWCRKTLSKNNFNISQVSHCQTNPDAVSRLAEATSIFLRCHTVTQIAMQ